ncbi:MAG: methionine--tRNA ligase [Planctomycetota bacterium]
MAEPTPKPFYLTTPIYYVNARPHIGHVYTSTIADVVARYHRLLGQEVFFLTGTDEHGKKVADAAREHGVSPQDYVDGIAGEFQAAFAEMGLTHDDFIRTTQPRHQQRAAAAIQQLVDQGDVYLGEYEGWYDQGQEEYVTENNAREADYQSVISGKPLVKVKESSYFFRLSRFQGALLEHIEANPGFIQPEARRNEVVSRVKAGLNDIAISRSTEPWGIPMPGDPSHSVYVWIDALLNYVTAPDANDRPELWPADVHLVGKEILWFHAVIWPAMLMALGRPLFHKVHAHSFWVAEGRKMSKSLGNFVDLDALRGYVDRFGLDAVRWYLATQGPMGATDADFADAKFIEVYNSELANTLGNCVSRVAKMTSKYFDGAAPAPFADPQSEPDRIPAQIESCFEKYQAAMSELDLAGAAKHAMGVVEAVDGFIERTQPFKLAKDDNLRGRLSGILYDCAEALRIASVLLWPFLPTACEEVWRRLGCDYARDMAAAGGAGRLAEWAQWGGLQPGQPVQSGDALFQRYRPD